MWVRVLKGSALAAVRHSVSAQSLSVKQNSVIGLFQFSSQGFISLVIYLSMLMHCTGTMCVLCVMTYHLTCKVNPCGDSISFGEKTAKISVPRLSKDFSLIHDC